MGLSRRIFTKEFKLAAVQRLERGSSIGEVARALEVNPNVLHRWRREIRQGPGNVFPGHGQQRWAEGRVADLEDLQIRQALAYNDSDLCARGCRVCPLLRQAARSNRRRAHSPLSTVPRQREESSAVHLHSSGLRTAVPVYPHAPPEGRDRTHSVSPARKKASADFEPRRSKSPVGGGHKSAASHPVGDPAWLRTQSQRSRSLPSRRHRQHPQRAVGSLRQTA
jgi:transposase-like protein